MALFRDEVRRAQEEQAQQEAAEGQAESEHSEDGGGTVVFEDSREMTYAPRACYAVVEQLHSQRPWMVSGTSNCWRSASGLGTCDKSGGGCVHQPSSRRSQLAPSTRRNVTARTMMKPPPAWSRRPHLPLPLVPLRHPAG